ncbi:hypothetical protein, partial [Pseudomonas sp. FW215-R4]|uniref:hypothetical protein n=2 Tax=unclassified Pseudomonas TaxID=196821 RepID=UPI001C46EB9A
SVSGGLGVGLIMVKLLHRQMGADTLATKRWVAAMLRLVDRDVGTGAPEDALCMTTMTRSLSDTAHHDAYATYDNPGLPNPVTVFQ